MKFEIEKNIPYQKTTSYKYPFADMEVGDSFLFPGDRKKANAIRNSAFNFARESGNGHKFSVRRVGSENYRIWRIK